MIKAADKTQETKPRTEARPAAAPPARAAQRSETPKAPAPPRPEDKAVLTREKPEADELDADAIRQLVGDRKKDPDQDGIKTDAPDQRDIKTDRPDPGDIKTDLPDQGDIKTDRPDPGDIKTDPPGQAEIKTDAPDQGDVKTDSPDQDGIKTDPPESDKAPEDPNLGDTTQVLLDNLEQLDRAAGQGGQDDQISREDLEAAANDPNASQELKDAVKAVLGNENWLNALDLGEGDGDVDRRIDRGDLEAVLREEQEHGQRLSIEETAAVLRDNFELFDTAAGSGGKDEKISQDDLEAIAGNDQIAPEVREAAMALLENKNYSHALDVATGRGETDGTYSLKDINAAADRGFLDDPGTAQDPAASMEVQNDVLTVAQSFDQLDVAKEGGDPDGTISQDDLESALEDSNTSPELKQAIEGILGNEAALNALDVGAGSGDVDGKFNRNDIVKFVSSGLERAADNAHEQDELFSAFTAQYGQFIQPEDLMSSREAQRVKSAHEGHEALAANFTELFKDPRFQEVFSDLPEDQKIGVVSQVADDLTGTVAGQDFIDQVVGDVAAVGRGESAPSNATTPTAVRF